MPQIHIPQKAVPWIVGVLGVAGVLTQVVPAYTIFGKILAGIAALGGAFAAASPGFNNSNQ